MQEWSGDKFEKSTTMTTAGAARPRSHQETVTPVDEEENGSAYFQVDSEDIDIGMSSSGQPFTLAGLLQNMSPAKCLQPATDMVTVCTSTAYKSCTGSERDELEHQILGILKEVRGGNIKARTIALQKLYRLTDREHRQNRVPVVCTTKFETVQTLVTVLGEGVPHSDRRHALLILNNLCIPPENKAAILFGEPAEHLITALLHILQNRLAESYLAAVTLLNLSYLQDDHAKTMLFTYIPILDTNKEASETYSYQLPVDNPLSLIRTLESVMKEFCVYVPQRHIHSVEQQCVRWCMNVVRNLVSTVHDNAVVVGMKTFIPAIAAECLSHADTSNLNHWTRDSLEDACLMLLVHVCKIDACLERLKSNERVMDQAIAVCEELESSAEGIHQRRAAALLERLDDGGTRSVGYSV